MLLPQPPFPSHRFLSVLSCIGRLTWRTPTQTLSHLNSSDERVSFAMSRDNNIGSPNVTRSLATAVRSRRHRSWWPQLIRNGICSCATGVMTGFCLSYRKGWIKATGRRSRIWYNRRKSKSLTQMKKIHMMHELERALLSIISPRYMCNS